MEIVGGGESGMNWESSVDISTLQRKTESSWEPAVERRELSSVLCGDLDGLGWGCGEAQVGEDMCIYIADSFYCTKETNTTYKQLYTHT